MNAGIRIIDHGDHASLEISGESVAARRDLGSAAWSVLEILALAGCDEDGVWVATTNARDLAGRLGIGKDRAAAALGVLRRAGLVVAHTSREATTSRFSASRYEVGLPVWRADDAFVPPQAPSRTEAPRPRARTRDASTFETLDLFSAP